MPTFWSSPLAKIALLLSLFLLPGAAVAAQKKGLDAPPGMIYLKGGRTQVGNDVKTIEEMLEESPSMRNFAMHLFVFHTICRTLGPQALPRAQGTDLVMNPLYIYNIIYIYIYSGQGFGSDMFLPVC